MLWFSNKSRVLSGKKNLGELIPPGHSVCLPEEIRKISCIENACQIMVDCSKCVFIKEWMTNTGCPNNTQAFKTCKKLEKCGC